MPSSPGENYLETDILTATPQKLQLMLIEGALNRIERVRAHWQAGENDRANEELICAQEIITELMAGLNRQASPELVKKIAAIYIYIFRCLLDAGLGRDETKLDEAIRVLDVERETWQQVCREVVSSQLSEAHKPNSPPAPHIGMADVAQPGSFSIEA